jgi:hypothetical protein
MAITFQATLLIRIPPFTSWSFASVVLPIDQERVGFGFHISTKVFYYHTISSLYIILTYKSCTLQSMIAAAGSDTSTVMGDISLVEQPPFAKKGPR